MAASARGSALGGRVKYQILTKRTVCTLVGVLARFSSDPVCTLVFGQPAVVSAQGECQHSAHYEQSLQDWGTGNLPSFRLPRPGRRQCITHTSCRAHALSSLTSVTSYSLLFLPTAALTGANEAGVPAEMQRVLHRYMRNSLAVSTQSNLRTALKHFEAFIGTIPNRSPLKQPRWDGDLSAALHNEMTFMLFLAHLVKDGSRLANTALNYVSLARTHLASMAGYPLATKSPRWKKLVKAIKKAHTSERKECLPLRMSHLRRAFGGGLAVQQAFAVNRWAAVVSGVHLLARPAELAGLKRSDLSFADHPIPHAVVQLKPLKKGPEQLPVPMLVARGDGGGGDAYAALARLVTVDPVPESLRASTPLFRDHRGNPPSNITLTQWVQSVAGAAGLGVSAQLFTARSLRIGGATELHAVGANELTISLLGRWSSDCARLYTRASQGQVLALSQQLAGAPEDPALEQAFLGYTQTARR